MKLVGLFDSQREVGNVVEALSTDALSSTVTRVIEGERDSASPNTPTGNDTLVLSPPAPAAGARTAVPLANPTASEPFPISDLKLSKPEERFVKKGLREGGVAVIVELGDAAQADVKQVLEKHNGTVLEE